MNRKTFVACIVFLLSLVPLADNIVSSLALRVVTHLSRSSYSNNTGQYVASQESAYFVNDPLLGATCAFNESITAATSFQ